MTRLFIHNLVIWAFDLLLVITLFSVRLSGQNRNYVFDKITKANGLSNGVVNAILQDSKGFLWVGTWGGLCRYDGYKFKIFQSIDEDSTTLTGNGVKYLAEDLKGRLWVGCNNGLCYFNPEIEQFKRILNDIDDKNSIINNSISSLLIDSRSNLWVGTRQGISILEITNSIDFSKTRPVFKNYTHSENDPHSISNNFIYHIFEDRNKNIWINPNGHIIDKYDPEKHNFRHFPIILPEIEKKGELFAIYEEDQDDLIWLGSNGEGLISWNRENNFFKQYKSIPGRNSLSGNIVTDIWQNEDGMLWISTDGGGISFFNKKTESFEFCRHNVSDPKSINSDAIYTIYQDNSGIIWLGTYKGGLNKLMVNKTNFGHFTYNPLVETGLGYNSIKTIIEDRQGLIWIGTDGGGLDIFDRKTMNFKHFRYNPKDKNTISGNVVVSLYEDSEENIWIGTYSEGLCVYNKKENNFRRFRHNPEDPFSISNNDVYAINEDRKGNIWIGTLQGILNLYNRKSQKFYHYKNDPKDSNSIIETYIKKIFIDSRDYFWIATPNGLELVNLNNVDLGVYPPKLQFIHFTHKAKQNSISSGDVNTIFEDSDKNLWFGTESGLNKLNVKSNKFSSFLLKDGFPSNSISAILEDNDKNLWIAGSNGLSKFNPKIKTIINYTVYDGLQDPEFSRAACKTKDGQLFFGGVNGFNAFYPFNIQVNTNPPKVIITDLKIHNRPIKVGEEINSKIILEKSINEMKEIKLSYKENFISFEFAALDFLSPEKNKFAYKMEGFDEQWRFTDAGNRLATYTNLDAGKYTFNVKASNSDGVWNETYASIHLIITPPYWKTWWFKILLIFLLIIASIFYFLVRIKDLNRQNLLLEQKVLERTTQLSETNAELEEQKEEIIQQKEEILSQRDELELKRIELEGQKEEIVKAYNNIQVISEFGQKITASLDPKEISFMIYDYISSLMHVNTFGIGIYNPVKNIIEFTNFIENGNKRSYFHKEMNDEISLSVRCYKNNEEIIINTVSEDYREYISKQEGIETDIPFSVIHIPLTIENKPIGTVSVSSNRKDAYVEKDIVNMRALASYIVIALDNANAYKIVQSKNEAINSSLRYGSRIQKAMLVNEPVLNEYFESFIIFKPKDLVSGDFYWLSVIPTPSKIFLAVVDCTGHGVPGAFMSMIGNRLLNEIVNEKKIYEPGKILDNLNHEVGVALQRDQTDNTDGMDIALVMIEGYPNNNNNNFTLEFAGAKLPLYYIRKNGVEINSLNSDRQSIGGIKLKHEKHSFSQQNLVLSKGDTIYLSTDGIIDQCDVKRKRFSSRRLIELLQNNVHLTLAQQKLELENAIEQHMKGEEQRDDITLLGIRF